MTLSLQRKLLVHTGLRILDQAFERVFVHNLGPHKSVSELLSKETKKVEGICRVLEQIGLVTPDEIYPFGFKPTEILEDIVRRRGFRPIRNSKKEEPTLEEEEFLLSIYDAALPEEEWCRVAPFADLLLHLLGLVVYSQSGDEIPTPELRVFVALQRNKQRSERKRAAKEAGATGIR
jgi:hypothetical protein